MGKGMLDSKRVMACFLNLIASEPDVSKVIRLHIYVHVAVTLSIVTETA